MESSLEGQKTLEQVEIARNEQFLLFLQCFQKNSTKKLKNKGVFGKRSHL